MKLHQLLIVVLGLCSATYASDNALLVATYNIRYKNAEDVARGDGWDTRLPHVAGLILFHGFDLIGLQEVTGSQLRDLAGRLDGFAHAGVSRDGPGAAGEHTPVFWRESRFELLDSDTFWLSETPGIASRGWDALLPRICTWVKLRDKRTDKIVHFWNTHFDHRGVVARRQSSEFLLARLLPLLQSDEPVILLGDFNSTPETEAYATLAGGLKDTLTLSATPPYGPVGTTNGFNYNGTFLNRIDYIFVSKRVKVLSHGTLTDSYAHRFPSDHFPVVTRIVLPQ